VGIAIITLLVNETYYVRQIVLTCLVGVWGIRLAGFLFIRILKIGEDKRYWIHSLFQKKPKIERNFFFFSSDFFAHSDSMTFVPTLSNSESGSCCKLSPFGSFTSPSLSSIRKMPTTISRRLIMWAGACGSLDWCPSHWPTIRNSSIETIPTTRATGVMSAFGSSHVTPIILEVSFSFSFQFGGNGQREELTTLCPLFFCLLAEICCWWGVFMSAAVAISDWEWLSVISPLYITLVLMFGSGIPTTEKSTDVRFWNNEEYQQYRKNTPVLVPFIPGLFGGIAKVIFCCEWPLYRYPPENQKLKEEP
jgi:hypothetical protein